MGTIPWYVARASGIVAWALVLATVVWGLFLATRVLGKHATPAWLLSLHRYLGTLTVAFVAVHVGSVLLDSYTSFGPTDVLVPFASSWHPVAVAWGIVGMYLLAAIEVTSLLRKRLSKRTWHAVHLLSYLLFAVTTIHMVTAGTDLRTVITTSATVLLGLGLLFGAGAMYAWRSDDDDRTPAIDRSRRIPVR